MKKKVLLMFYFTILLCSISFLNISCSNEFLITSAGDENVYWEENPNEIEPLVEKWLEFSKLKIKTARNIPKDRIEKLDTFLLKNRVSQLIVGPYLPQCGFHSEYVWLPQDEYIPVPNKSLGIWQSNSVVNLYNCYNKYGFKEVLITDLNNIQNALNAGFKKDSIMFGLGDPSTAPSQVISARYNVGSFYIDEPQENLYELHKWFWSYDQINSLNNQYIYPSGKRLYLSSYKDQLYHDYIALSYLTNVYIMCDEYHGNCDGTVNDYWNKFRNYFYLKNVSNWVEVVANNGDGNTHRACPYINEVSTNFNDLFINANTYGMNHIWLYANLTGSENGVSEFSSTAWINGWLLRKYKYAKITWKCDDLPLCQSCVWGYYGNWYISDITYTGASMYSN